MGEVIDDNNVCTSALIQSITAKSGVKDVFYLWNLKTIISNTLSNYSLFTFKIQFKIWATIQELFKHEYNWLIENVILMNVNSQFSSQQIHKTQQMLVTGVWITQHCMSSNAQLHVYPLYISVITRGLSSAHNYNNFSQLRQCLENILIGLWQNCCKLIFVCFMPHLL